MHSASYAIFDRVLSSAEITEVIDALELASVRRTKAGARHILSVSAVARLATDARLVTIATNFIGPGAIPFRVTLFDKSPDANWLVPWHQDTALPLQSRVDDVQWGPWSEKAGVLYAHAPAWALEQVVALRVSLDASTPTNGPLCLLPDSHRHGVLSDDEITLSAKIASGRS